MGGTYFYCAGTTEACSAAAKQLQDNGIHFLKCPGPEVTDLLLDIPSFSGPGILRGGEAAESLLKQVPDSIRIWGGKLSQLRQAYPCFDLLQDPGYLAENGAITADCAVRLCGPRLQTTWCDSRVLVIGWGRIGKSLCRILRSLGAKVTVCARKPQDRALLSAFGYETVEPDQLDGSGFQVIFNTAPAAMMEEDDIGSCPIAIDLASSPGLLGPQAESARGLPGIYAPKSSGKLIADTILKQLRR